MSEVKKEFFITHIGQVTVNNWGTIQFENKFEKLTIMSDQTLTDLCRGVKYYIKEMKEERVWRKEKP